LRIVKYAQLPAAKELEAARLPALLLSEREY
jgi:hypothetical protein